MDRKVRKHMKAGGGISAIIFWGALWGFVEATLGYILHLLPYNAGWLLWFPLAFYFMHQVYKQTGSAGAVLFTAGIAAALKLVDLNLPASIDRIINPAFSILFEGLAVSAVFVVLSRKKLQANFVSVLAAGFFWRLIYLAYLFLVPAWMFAISAVKGIIPMLAFLCGESLANSLVIYAYIKLTKKENEHKYAFHPAISGCVLALAVFTRLLL